MNKNLKRLDVLKPRIKKRYEEHVRLRRDAEARRTLLLEETKALDQANHNNTLIPYSGQHLEASANRDLAVKLAQEEISRRSAAQSHVLEKDRSGHGGTQGKRASISNQDLEALSEGDNLSQQLQAVAARVEPHRGGSIPRTNNVRFAQGNSNYRYPTVPANQGDVQLDTRSRSNALENPPGLEGQGRLLPPRLPPKPLTTSTQEPPPLPAKPMATSSSDILRQPTAYTFAPAAYLENETPLRTLFLPPTLRTTFLRVAHNNTLANLETCAFLAGTVISNALFVSKLIVPAQTSTSDTCEMTNESQLFDYVDSESDLMILGWIHTHPSQTCFMSSRDLHTHASYQMMLAESVALVCAPSKGDTSHGGDWGVYRLTDPPGKTTILACQKPGIFHPHDVDNVYTDALRPGHVVEAKGLEFELVDLRGG